VRSNCTSASFDGGANRKIKMSRRITTSLQTCRYPGQRKYQCALQRDRRCTECCEQAPCRLALRETPGEEPGSDSAAKTWPEAPLLRHATYQLQKPFRAAQEEAVAATPIVSTARHLCLMGPAKVPSFLCPFTVRDSKKPIRSYIFDEPASPSSHGDALHCQ